MKFLHISDLHIGKRVNGISLVDDQVHILNQIAAIARECGVDALVIAGDIYDKASPSAEAVTVFDSFLTEIARSGIRVLAVPGNHDSSERIAYAQQLLANQGVCFPPVFDGAVQRVDLQDEHGEVAFWLLPFLKPGDVRRHFPDQPIGEDYAAALRAVIASCGVDRAKRNVVVSHQLVIAGGKSPDRADDEIKLGGIDAVDVSVYADFDYVALGHVHRAQRVGRDTVRYSGSPLKYSFSEARYDKSAVLVQLGPKREGDDVGDCASFELVPLVPLHDMREVRMSLADLLAEGAALRDARNADVAEGGSAQDREGDVQLESGAHEGDGQLEGEEREGDGGDAGADAADGVSHPLSADPANDYLHVTLTDEHPQLDAMRKIHEVFPNAMTLDYDNAVILAAREQVRTAVDPDKVDAVDLFARFYEEQVGKPLDDIQHDIVAQVVRDVDAASAAGKGGAR